jgi:hypothetical protein
MSESPKDAWSEVGVRFASWGQRVAERYKEAGSPQAAAEESQRDLERTAKELMDELARGFAALSQTFKDDEANRELGGAVNAIGEAIKATVDEAKQGIRSAGGSGTNEDGV